MSRRHFILGLAAMLVINGCTPKPDATSSSPMPPQPVIPQVLIPPTISSFSLPTTASRTASGFAVYGSGQTINPAQSSNGRSDENGDVTFNFVNADVTAVAHTIFSEVLRENYTIDGGVQGLITLQTTRPISRDEIIPALETSLKAANLALTLETDGYHIVPLASAGEGGAGNFSVAGGPQTPGYGTEVIPLKYANAAAVAKLIEPLAGPGVQIQVDSDRNLLIVAGTSQDRSTIAANIAVFDVDGLANMSYALVPLQTASADSIVKEVNQFIGSNSSMNGLVRLVVIGQLNAILVITQQEAYLGQIRSLISRLDQQQPSDEQQVFVYHLQNAEAKDIAGVLNRLLDPQDNNNGGANNSNGQADSPAVPDTQSSSNAGNSNSQNGNAGAPSLANFGSSPPQQNGASGLDLDNQNDANPLLGSAETPSNSASSAGDNVVNQPRITADDTNNDLLIFATPAQFNSIQNALVQLDVQPRQVMLEAIVAEVTLTNQLQYGVQYFLQSGNVTSGNTIGKALAVAASPPGFSAILDTGNVQILLSALESVTHVNVISAPKLMVLNNQAAQLQVGDEVPITTQTAQSTDTGTAPLVSTVSYQDTGVILHVTPRINEGGLVTLDVSQEVSEVSTTTTSTLNSPTISERKISTIVAVPDGQTVALGGLIQSSQTKDDSGIPILSSIPILGYLFSNHDNSGSRTELLILITPHVVQSASALQAVTDELRSEMVEVQATQ